MGVRWTVELDTKVEPCPLCGGKAKMVSVNRYPTEGGPNFEVLYSVTCFNALMYGVNMCTLGVKELEYSYTREKAIARWNNWSVSIRMDSLLNWVKKDE